MDIQQRQHASSDISKAMHVLNKNCLGRCDDITLLRSMLHSHRNHYASLPSQGDTLSEKVRVTARKVAANEVQRKHVEDESLRYIAQVDASLIQAQL